MRFVSHLTNLGRYWGESGRHFAILSNSGQKCHSENYEYVLCKNKIQKLICFYLSRSSPSVPIAVSEIQNKKENFKGVPITLS